MRHSFGFTLAELMIALAVVGILAAVAAPSFTSIILAQRIKSTSFDLIASLTYARSEAIKQNGSVTIAPMDGNWANGWTLTGPDSTILRSQAAIQSLTITGPATIVYGRGGRVTSGNGNIQIDDNQSDATAVAHCITIDLTGIPRSRQGAC